MNDLIFFTKLFRTYDLPGLAGIAHDFGLDGLDLCVRAGYPVNPTNVLDVLPGAVRDLAQDGVKVPMVTGSLDLIWPDDPTAKPLLRAMDKSGIHLLKLGYYPFDPFRQHYWTEVDLPGALWRAGRSWPGLIT